jgi:hypothetical protein
MSRSPITSWARSYVRARATEVMEYTCRITRSGPPATYDEDSLVYTPDGIAEVIYEGKCRIWELSGASMIAVGEAEVIQQPTQMSIPWDAPVSVMRYDQVEVLTAPAESQMVGERFEIQTVAKAGELRATRRFEISGVM